MIFRKTSPWVLALAVLASASPSFASVHLMQIEQIVGGWNGDSSVQAIQLRMRSTFQNQTQTAKLVVRDANGANPITLSAPGGAVANHGAGVTILFATANFSSATTPAAVPDFTMTSAIPSSYLAAGSLTFESSLGNVFWRVSWGGGGYTGSTTGELFNDADGQFAPNFAGSLPSEDNTALRFTGAATAQSTNNAANYAISGSEPTFKNNAGSTFTLNSAPSVVPERVPSPVNSVRAVYPNPFNPQTTVSFQVAEEGWVDLRVYDVAGRLVDSLWNGRLAAGLHERQWDGRDSGGSLMSSGSYFVTLRTAGQTHSRRVVLVK